MLQFAWDKTRAKPHPTHPLYVSLSMVRNGRVIDGNMQGDSIFAAYLSRGWYRSRR